MSFLQLVQREMQGSLPRLLFMSALGGISTAAVLASINAGVQSVNNGQKPSLWAAIAVSGGAVSVHEDASLRHHHGHRRDRRHHP